MAQTPLPPAPGVVELKATYLVAGQQLQNTYHVHSIGEWSAGELQALADLYGTIEVSDFAELRGSGCSLISVRCTDLSTPQSGYFIGPVNPPVAGTAVGELLPANVTLAVQLSTGLRGRGEQGRIFWIGMVESMTQGSVIDAAIASSMIGAMTNWLNAVNIVEDWQLVILHRQNNGLALNPATWTPVQTIVVADTTTDSQKNRLPNHRRHKRPAA